MVLGVRRYNYYQYFLPHHSKQIVKKSRFSAGQVRLKVGRYRAQPRFVYPRVKRVTAASGTGGEATRPSYQLV